MIATWYGRPVHELSKDELRAAVSQLMAENRRLQDVIRERSAQHIRDLAAQARR